MSTLDSRGHEVVDPKPFEPVVPVRRPEQSVFDIVRAEIMRARAAADDEITSEDDLLDDMTDFDMPAFDDGLVGPSPFEIEDDVPDKLPASSETPKTEETVSNVPATEKTPETAPEA